MGQRPEEADGTGQRPEEADGRLGGGAMSWLAGRGFDVVRQAGASGQRPKEAKGGRIIVHGTAEEEKGADSEDGRRRSGWGGRPGHPVSKRGK